MLHDISCRRRPEMRAQHKRFAILVFPQKITSRGTGHSSIVIKMAPKTRYRHLYGMMDRVTRNDCLGPIRAYDDANMTGRVTWSRDELDFVSHPVVRFHKLMQPSVDNGLQGIREHSLGVHHVTLVDWNRARDLFMPELPLKSSEKISGVGKSRHPPIIGQLSVPTDVVDVQMRAQYNID